MRMWTDKQKKLHDRPDDDAVFKPYKFQAPIIEDGSRLIGWVKSRQIGGSTIGTLKVALSAVQDAEDWNTMSRSGRQAKRLLRRFAKHIEAIDLYVRRRLGHSTIIEKIATEEIVLKNGAIISAMPCDPDTTVGDTVNWFLDEVGLYLQREIFGIIKPSILHGRRMVMVSSPRGRQGTFSELYHSWLNNPQESGWSFHVTTIEEAIAGGMVIRDQLGRPMTFEQFKKQELHDFGFELFMQEYMCSFLATVSALLKYETIEACARQTDSIILTPTQFAAKRSQIIKRYIGIDIGRFRDLTVIWIIALYPDGSMVTESVQALDGVPIPIQANIIAEYLKTGCFTRCCIDYMGTGIGVYDALNLQFPGIVEKVSFTNASKQEMAHRLKMEMEARNFLIFDDEDIIEDFASIERVIMDSGNVRLEARAGGKTHGDYFWGAALARHGIDQFGPTGVAMAVA